MENINILLFIILMIEIYTLYRIDKDWRDSMMRLEFGKIQIHFGRSFGRIKISFLQSTLTNVFLFPRDENTFLKTKPNKIPKFLVTCDHIHAM